jgi:hypothetical protein
MRSPLKVNVWIRPRNIGDDDLRPRDSINHILDDNSETVNFVRSDRLDGEAIATSLMT